jgi:ABC transporter substrate binding protein
VTDEPCFSYAFAVAVGSSATITLGSVASEGRRRRRQTSTSFQASGISRQPSFLSNSTKPRRSPPDLIIASSSPVTAALKQATHTIPIVFSVVNDPVGQGFVASLAHPGGNITGFTFVDFPMIGNG